MLVRMETKAPEPRQAIYVLRMVTCNPPLSPSCATFDALEGNQGPLRRSPLLERPCVSTLKGDHRPHGHGGMNTGLS